MTRRRQLLTAFAASLLLLSCLTTAGYAQSKKSPKSPLSAGSVRNVIRRMTGSELPSSAVIIKRLSSPDKLTVEVLAQIETAFRFVREKAGWHVAEIRTGDNAWEETALILRALNSTERASACAETSGAAGREASDLSVEQARCLLAQLAGIELPSDAVRVRSVSSLALGNTPSAVVEARVEAEFRLRKGTDGKWRVAEIKTGNSAWADVELMASSINEQKRARAQEELELVAKALESFRRERGFYVEATAESALVDHLNPRYLRRVIRVDPWRKPYQYEGTRNSYVLSSNGADGKPRTADDIVRKND